MGVLHSKQTRNSTLLRKVQQTAALLLRVQQAADQTYQKVTQNESSVTLKVTGCSKELHTVIPL